MPGDHFIQLCDLRIGLLQFQLLSLDLFAVLFNFLLKMLTQRPFLFQLRLKSVILLLLFFKDHAEMFLQLIHVELLFLLVLVETFLVRYLALIIGFLNSQALFYD